MIQFENENEAKKIIKCIRNAESKTGALNILKHNGYIKMSAIEEARKFYHNWNCDTNRSTESEVDNMGKLCELYEKAIEEITKENK